MEIVCPSGLRGLIRGMKVRELSTMSDARLIRSGKIIDKLVSACWEKTLSPGPYNLNADTLPWENMLQGDRAYAFIHVRAATFGNEYAFEYTCANPACNFKYEVVVQLDTLKKKDLPSSSYEHISRGAPLKARIADKNVSFRLLRCSDDQRMKHLTEQLGLSFPTAQIVTRIVEVEGTETSDIEAVAAWVEDLGLAEGLELREKMEEADCGLEMQITTVCPKSSCGNEETFDLPLGQGFFQTRKTKKA